MAEGSVLGVLFEVGADPSKAIGALSSFRGQAGSALKEIEEQMLSTMTKSIGITKEFAVSMAVGTGAVIGLSVAMFELAHKASEVGAKIYETSEKTGFSAEALSGVNAVTKMTGESFDGLSMALSRASINLTKGIQDPAHGVGLKFAEMMGSAKNLAELGLKPADERLQILLHHIFAIKDAGKRNIELNALMGRGWMQNAATLKYLAEEGFGPAIEQAKKFGIFFTQGSGAKAKQFEIEWATVQARMSALAMVIGQDLIPKVSAFIMEWDVWMEFLQQKGPWEYVKTIAKEAVLSILNGLSFIVKVGESIEEYLEKLAGRRTVALGGAAKQYHTLSDMITTYSDKQKALVEKESGLNKVYDDREKLQNLIANPKTPPPSTVEPKDTAEKLAKAKKRIEDELALVEYQAKTELSIYEKLNEGEYEGRREALDRWHETQVAGMVKAADAIKKLFGATSEEYRVMVNKLNEFGDEYVLKRLEQDKLSAENFIKYIKPSAEFYKEAEKAFVEETAKANAQIETELKATTSKTIADILARNKLVISEQQKKTDDELKVEEKYLALQLKLHKTQHDSITAAQKAAEERWYTDRAAALKRQMDITLSVYKYDSDQYQKLLAEKEALDDQYAALKAGHTDKELSDKVKLRDASLGVLEALDGAFKKSHALQIANIVAHAAIKVYDEMAAGFGYLADGNDVSAALAFMSAAQYAIVAGGQVAGVGGGGGASAGAGGRIQPNVYGGNSPVRAPGALPVMPGGNVTVQVMGTTEAGTWMAGVISAAVTTQGAKLNATHSSSNQPLG